MKTYVLMIAKRFPVNHPKAGKQTDLGLHIWNGTKIHTIRSNYDLWKKRETLVNTHKAYVSGRQWTGKPYRSTQDELFDFTSIRVQKLYFTDNTFSSAIIDGVLFADIGPTLAMNDGLNFHDFQAWFKGHNISKPLALIQFSDFTYQIGKPLQPVDKWVCV